MLVPPEQASSALKALALLAHLLLGRIVGGVNGVGVMTVVDIGCIGVESEQHIRKKHISANTTDMNNGL